MVSSKKYALVIITAMLSCAYKKNPEMALTDKWRVSEGNGTDYSKSNFNDSGWQEIDLALWVANQNKDLNDTVWYRYHIQIPSFLKKDGYDSASLKFVFKQIRGEDQFYLNGQLIEENERSFYYKNQKRSPYFPDPGFRSYFIPANANIIKWDQDNLIALRVIDKTGNGGFLASDSFISTRSLEDDVAINVAELYKPTSTGTVSRYLRITNVSAGKLFSGKLEIKCESVEFKKDVFDKVMDVKLKLDEEGKYLIDLPLTIDPVSVSLKLTDERSGYRIQIADTLKYVLEQ